MTNEDFETNPRGTMERLEKAEANYWDLIQYVGKVVPGEARHETAKRFIRVMETPCAGCRGDSDEHSCHTQCAANPDAL